MVYQEGNKSQPRGKSYADGVCHLCDGKKLGLGAREKGTQTQALLSINLLLWGKPTIPVLPFSLL